MRQGGTCVSKGPCWRAWRAGWAAAADNIQRKGSEEAGEAATLWQQRQQQQISAGATHFPPPAPSGGPTYQGQESAQDPPRLRIALSKGARPLRDLQTEPNVPFYNLPAPAALPPPA